MSFLAKLRYLVTGYDADAYREYVAALRHLFYLYDLYAYDDPAVDVTLDQMDDLWWAMSGVERGLAEAEGARLNAELLKKRRGT